MTEEQLYAKIVALEVQIGRIKEALLATAALIPRLAYQDKIEPGLDLPKLYDRLVQAAIKACEKAAK